MKLNIKYLFLIFILSLSGLSYMIYDTLLNKVIELPYLGPQEKNDDGVLSYHAADLSSTHLIDQNGQAFNWVITKGKISIVNFFFTSCPSICPVMMKNIGEITDHFSGDNHIIYLSYTVDPKRDTPEKLHEYAKDRSINADHWKLLTGEKKEIYALARNAYYLVATEGDGGPTDFIHSENLVLIDALGHIRGYYDGTEETEVEQLKYDAKRLLKT